mgnify:CR=1 FL=1
MRKYKWEKKYNNGITLIALVVTIILLIILARYKYINAYRQKWSINKVYRIEN